MKALSIKQPWAHAILHLGKDVENRDWKTNFTGTIALHASKSMTKGDLHAFIIGVPIDSYPLEKNTEMMRLIDSQQMPYGAIVGTVEIVGCVSNSNSLWFFGDYGFVLKNPKPLVRPIPINGALGFWNVPADIQKEIEKQLLVTV